MARTQKFGNLGKSFELLIKQGFRFKGIVCNAQFYVFPDTLRPRLSTKPRSSASRRAEAATRACSGACHGCFSDRRGRSGELGGIELGRAAIARKGAGPRCVGKAAVRGFIERLGR
jgi:hypothetical protein